MKTNIFILSLIFGVFSILFCEHSFSQVNVTPSNNSYSSLSSAFTAINSGSHGNGAVTVTIVSNLTESNPAALNGGVFTSCLIRPSGARSISANFNEAIIILDGADNVTIDGLNTGGNSLTLTNTNTGTNPGSIRISNGASNNIIRNLICNGIGTGAATGGRTIHVAASTTTIGNNNNIIENNIINGGRRGIQTFGTPGLISNSNTIIRNNKVKNISSLGIFVGTESINTTVSGNEIYMDTIVNTDVGFSAIRVQGVGIIDISGNGLHGFESSANSFNGINATPLLLSSPGSNATTLNITNNMISIANANPSTTEIFGIALRSITGTTTAFNSNVYFNSMLISGTSPGSSLTSGIFVSNNTAGSITNVKNNVSVNSRSGGDPATHHTGSMLTPYINTTISADYNIFYATDPVHGYPAGWGNVFYSDINYYKQSACSPDVNELHTIFSNSFEFVSQTDLHLLDSTVMDGFAAVPIAGITTDIDGAVRNSTYPYRGADELPDSFAVFNLGVSVQGVGTSGNEIISVGIVGGAPNYDVLCISIEVMNSANASSGAPVVLRFGPGVLFAMERFGPVYGIVCYDPHTLPTFSQQFAVFGPGLSVPVESYNFTTSVSQAYGNNQIIDGGVPSIYNGDVNQDLYIDLPDVLSVYNSASDFLAGNYLINDLTGNGTVDLTDILIVYNNSINFVSAISPEFSQRGIVNRESSIVNRQTSNREWSIVNSQ